MSPAPYLSRGDRGGQDVLRGWPVLKLSGRPWKGAGDEREVPGSRAGSGRSGEPSCLQLLLSPTPTHLGDPAVMSLPVGSPLPRLSQHSVHSFFKLLPPTLDSASVFPKEPLVPNFPRQKPSLSCTLPCFWFSWGWEEP